MPMMRVANRWLVAGLLLASLRVARADSEISLYGDTDAQLATTGTRSGTTDGFSAAHLDLFTTSTMGRWTFLSEVMFEAGTDNAFALDVERVEVGYLYREWLRVSVGRFHTAFGYYNDAFHHGSYFMLPVNRPTMVSFEDDGGLIPAHSVGVHLDGRLALGSGRLRYDLELANGHTSDPVEVQNSGDQNRSKAANVRLRYEAGGDLDGLIVGGNLYFDSIPAGPAALPATADPAEPAPLGAQHEWIAGVHVAYLEHHLHIIAEAMAVQHTELDHKLTHRTYGAFVELGRAFGAVTPYARYEWIRFPRGGDPYLGRTFGDGHQGVAVGLKHATTDNVALKAQAGLTRFPHSDADTILTITGQLAFAF